MEVEPLEGCNYDCSNQPTVVVPNPDIAGLGVSEVRDRRDTVELTSSRFSLAS
jgi:hypothetical protein